MDVWSIVFYALVAAAATIVAAWCVHGVWRAIGLERFARALRERIAQLGRVCGATGTDASTGSADNLSPA